MDGQTPRSQRLHIGILGRRNSGKSTLLNRLTNQNISLVSETPGTTTDPVYKNMELPKIGPCVWIDTAGFDDTGDLGTLRIQKTKEVLDRIDVAILVCTVGTQEIEYEWYQQLKKKKIPIIVIVNQRTEGEKADSKEDIKIVDTYWKKILKESVLVVNIKRIQEIAFIINPLIRSLNLEDENRTILGSLVSRGDFVLLVMPQDIQAPKGRMILPQVQVLRELLDRGCIIQSCTLKEYEIALNFLKVPPKLIITDASVFSMVYEKKPKESMITSFSILFADYKGDLSYYKKSIEVIEKLPQKSKILIVEACTHASSKEDIGRVKIPNLLREKIGPKIIIEVASGGDFPEDLTAYDFIIHCGACMFTRTHMMNRVEKAKEQSVPMSNYGIVMAYLTNTLDKVSFEKPENRKSNKKIKRMKINLKKEE